MSTKVSNEGCGDVKIETRGTVCSSTHRFKARSVESVEKFGFARTLVTFFDGSSIYTYADVSTLKRVIRNAERRAAIKPKGTP